MGWIELPDLAGNRLLVSGRGRVDFLASCDRDTEEEGTSTSLYIYG